MLTKSLHTVTAVTNVARHLLETQWNLNYRDANAITHAALIILGYPDTIESDPTVSACVKSVNKMLAQSTRQISVAA